MRSLILIAALVFTGPAPHAQQLRANTKDLPDAPKPKLAYTDPAPSSNYGGLKKTAQVLSSRTLLFPQLNYAKARPLTSGEKLQLGVDESIAPSRFLGSMFTAAIGQAQNSLPGYGQGWGGYGKRFGSSVASAAADHMFGTYLLPSALHQDPRYFIKGSGSIAGRVVYAAERVVVTRTDAGRSTFNWSNVLAALMTEGLANSYLPGEERTTGKTFSRFGLRLALNVAGNATKEFLPQVLRGLHLAKIGGGASDPGSVSLEDLSGQISSPVSPGGVMATMNRQLAGSRTQAAARTALLVLASAGAPFLSSAQTAPVQAKPTNEKSDAAVHVFMRNVRFRFSDNVSVRIRSLTGAVVPTGDHAFPLTDDKHSFKLRIDTGEIVILPGDLANVLNSYVFARPNAPLSGISISIEKGQLKIKGRLRDKGNIPFETIGTLSTTPDGRVRLHSDKVKALHIPVTGLMGAFGVEIDDLIKNGKVPGVQPKKTI